MSLTKWCRPAGIELTRYRPWEFDQFVPARMRKQYAKKYGKDTYDYEAACQGYRCRKGDRLHSTILKEGYKLARQHPKLIERFGTDPYCFEVASAHLKSWQSLRRFFTVVDDFLDQHGCLRFHEDICGAGGHVHIGLTEDKEAEEASKIVKQMLNHPEVMFAFANPGDPQPCLRNLKKKELKHHQINRRHRSTGYYSRNEYDEEIRSQKRGPIAYRSYGTVEFRCFDIAQTLDMQEEHMAFAQAFVEWSLKQPLLPFEKLMTREDVEALTCEDCIARFKALIEELGLPWDRYEWYAENNIRRRFEWGTKNWPMF